MANQLNMNGLTLTDSKHAAAMPNGPNGRPAYIPPHLRGQPVRGGPPPMDGPAALPPGGDPGLGGSAWGNPRCVLLTTIIALQTILASIFIQQANGIIVP
jgi:hypothetical protein